jgi:protein-tyrosine phosphatase
MRGRWKAWLQRPQDAAVEPPAASVRILMVCMGNICRSPTAEGVLRAKLARAGLQGQVEVGSAGTQGYHAGEPPDPRAIRHAALRGYDIRGLRARPVRADDFHHFHRILALDEANLSWLRERKPEQAACELALLTSCVRGKAVPASVPDPYYGTAAGFEQVLDLVEEACDGLIEALEAGGLGSAPAPARDSTGRT